MSQQSFTLASTTRRGKAFLLALLTVAALGAVSSAEPLTLAVSGTYTDGSTFSGSIVYDQGAQTVISGSITDSTGASLTDNSGNVFLTAPANTYSGAGAYTISPDPGCQSNCEWFGLEFYTESSPQSLPYLDLLFYGDRATFTGGAIQTSLSYVDYFGNLDTQTSQEVIFEGFERGVAGGEVGAAAPEPASLALLLGGTAFLFWRRRTGLQRL